MHIFSGNLCLTKTCEIRTCKNVVLKLKLQFPQPATRSEERDRAGVNMLKQVAVRHALLWRVETCLPCPSPVSSETRLVRTKRLTQAQEVVSDVKCRGRRRSRRNNVRDSDNADQLRPRPTCNGTVDSKLSKFYSENVIYKSAQYYA